MDLAAERRLVEDSKRDLRQFAKLYERHFERIYAFALVRTGNRAAAEEVTGETFRRALQNLPGFEWRGVPFSAWLFRIAENAAKDLARQQGRETHLNWDAEPPDTSAEESLLEVERRAEISRLVRRLPADQQRVIELRFGQGKSVREAAELLRRSEGAIKALQFRALQKLKAWVGD